MDEELSIGLDDLRHRGLYRTLRRIDGMPGPRVVVDGREVIVFGSNNYLGLSTHPEVLIAAAQAVAEWGAGSTGSRLTTGNLRIHEELEREIAEFKGAEAALVFGTGYMAGIAAVTALVDRGDLILSDALNHASLIDGCRLSRAEVRVYRHNDVVHARELLSDRSLFRRCLIVTDGVFSMDGDIAPLADLRRLADEFEARLLVDDAHGTGVLGKNGTGTLEHLGVDRAGIVQMGTLSKALGSEGGFVAGSRVLIDYLINRARPFIFSTAPAPPSIAAARVALRIVRSEPERRAGALGIADRLRAGLRQAGFDVVGGQTPIVPVILGDSAYAAAFAGALLERGIYARAIRPPTVPEGTARLRMSVTAAHTAEDIDAAVKSMVKVRNAVTKG